MRIRSATPDDAEKLSALAMRSKAHWGYSESFLAQCKGELWVSALDIETKKLDCVVADLDGEIIGYGSIAQVSEEEFELDALFIEPSFIGKGLGRKLLQQILENVARKDGRVLLVQSDPNAAEFYRSCGGLEIGKSESASIPGRILPMFKYEIKKHECVT